MRKICALIIVAAFCATLPGAAFAGNAKDNNGAFVSIERDHSGTLHKMWHYISTHKELLASDAIIIAAWSADAASTINDERNCTSCIETNPVLGPHPTNSAVWLYASGWSAFQTTLNHLAWHYAPDPVLRHMVWIPTIITAVNEFPNVQNNVHWAEEAEEKDSAHPIGFGADPAANVRLGARKISPVWARQAAHTGIPVRFATDKR